MIKSVFYCFLLLVCTLFLLEKSATAQSEPAAFVRGEILVGFTDKATLEQADTLVKSFGLTWEPFPLASQASVFVWTRVTDRNLETYLTQLETNSLVLWAQIRGYPKGQPNELYLAIQFKEGVGEEAARSFFSSFPTLEVTELSVSEPWSPPKWGKIRVPVGEEKKWVNEFTKSVWQDPNTIIRYAELNQVMGPLGKDATIPIIDGRKVVMMRILTGVAVILTVSLVAIVAIKLAKRRFSPVQRTELSARKRRRWISIAIVLGLIGFIVYAVLFTSPVSLPLTSNKEGGVEFVGNLRRIAWSPFRAIQSGLMGSKDLCADNDCSVPPLPSIERETVTLSVTGEQITELVAKFKPKSVLIDNIRIEFLDDKGYASGTSFYPFFPGVVSVVARTSLGRFAVEEAYLGQVPVPISKFALLNDGGNYLIFDFLDSIAVSVTDLNISGDYLVVTIDVPIGLVRTDGDTFVVNAECLPGGSGEKCGRLTD